VTSRWGILALFMVAQATSPDDVGPTLMSRSAGRMVHRGAVPRTKVLMAVALGLLAPVREGTMTTA
jgi:hypothetical protein